MSFAVGLCEGPIDGIGRIWADGQVLDQGDLSYRLYTGSEDQMPDSLIAAIEGSGPAYRGVAYMVFEDLDLGRFGNRPPSLSVEVFRRPKGEAADMESLIEGVCLIPGAGEFVYATAHNAVREGLTGARFETQNTADGRPDFTVSLDQLAAQLPNMKRVNLVISWFGNDLRVGECRLRPGVEDAVRVTEPLAWTVAGLARDEAHLIGTYEGRPVYGGTPSDQTVIAAIQALKARGYDVTLVPFILMDIPGDNGLPDPYGGVAQATYPWRGRITSMMDGAASVADEVAAFFGGPDDWGLRRFVRHLASLAVAAGGVEAILLGSELRGLTTLRSGPETYPAVVELRALAAEVRAIAGPELRISYGADWSEYFGHQPGDGHVAFHLDPLWADDNIDFVGIDWYAPLTDWRDGDHLDLSVAVSIYDADYLKSRIRGGEGFDWYYASPADRDAQLRTPIIDGAHGEDWIFRPKDIRNWWANVHFNRPDGVRAVTPTDWVPQSKPVRFIEYGCGAIDKGPNAPNLFLDPKSSESFVPPYSSGARDDRAQREYLKAFASYYGDTANNPVSAIYDGPMLEGLDVWCWDARPYPWFPQRGDVWGDGPNWATGHWLNGRVGSGAAGNLLREIAAQAGVTLDVSEATGVIEGYVIEQPLTAARAMEPILSYLGLEMAERGAGLKVLGPVVSAPEVSSGALAYHDQSPVLTRRDMVEVPSSLTLRCYDMDRDYQVQAVFARHDAVAGGGGLSLDLSLCLTAAQARNYANYTLRQSQTMRETVSLSVATQDVLRFEAGDGVDFGGRLWHVDAIERAERPSMTLSPLPEARVAMPGMPTGGGGVIGTPVMTWFDLIDLPCFGPGSTDIRPVVVAHSAPFVSLEAYGGSSVETLTLRGRIDRPVPVGRSLMAVAPQQANLILRRAHIDVYLEGEAPMSRSEAEVLGGANILGLKARNGQWELIQFLNVTALGGRTYRLSGLIRAQWGTEKAMRAGHAEGATAVLLSADAERLDMAPEEAGLSRLWRVGRAGFGGAMAGSLETTAAWNGVALVPPAPVHGRIRGRFSRDMTIGWVRRSRSGGESLNVDPPLEDGFEAYRLRFYQGDDLRREIEVSTNRYLYTPEDQVVDFPMGFDGLSRLEIVQKSTTSVYGSALGLSLLT